MNYNSLKITWRMLTKYKVNNIINLSGLVVAFTVALLILVFIVHELSFDNFQTKIDRVYRLNSTISGDGEEMEAIGTSGKLPAILKERLPEIEHITRYYNEGQEVNINNQRYITTSFFWVDSSFFEIFDFEIINGNKSTCLKDPNSVVLTESIAKKMFGKVDPMNKVIICNGINYQVTALMKDPPLNSHMQFEMLGSFATVETPEYDVTLMNGVPFTFYVLLNKGVDYPAFFAKFKSVSDQHTKERFEGWGMKVVHTLQPMSRIHLHSKLSFENAKVSDIKNLYIFGFLALFILLIASVNYVNLMTAQAELRMKETGLRKVLGADRTHLIKQFLFESLIICLLALVISFSIADALLDPFGLLVDSKFNSSSLFNLPVVIIILFVAGLTSIVSGFYPAWIASIKNPASIMKGSKGNKASGSFSKYLVAFQFAITVFLIITVILIKLQVNYMKNKDLGFAKDNLVYIYNLTAPIRSSFDAIRSELLQNPIIENVTASQAVPGTGGSGQTCRLATADPNSGFHINENRIQDHYIETFKIKIVQGRDFDPQLQTDSAAFIINEVTVKKLGLLNPVGQKIVVGPTTGTVIGVMSDFNYASMRNVIDPLALSHYSKRIGMITARIRKGTTTEALMYIEKVIKSRDPNYNFEYQFIDQKFASMYAKEERFNNLISAGAIIAIVISVMGLFALTAFSVKRRVKEIGIRKTLGATVNQIHTLLAGKILVWIIPGLLVAFPFAWLAMEKWMSNFAYHITLINYWWVWMVGAAIALLVGFLTIYFQAIKAARENPIDCIRYE